MPKIDMSATRSPAIPVLLCLHKQGLPVNVLQTNVPVLPTTGATVEFCRDVLKQEFSGPVHAEQSWRVRQVRWYFGQKDPEHGDYSPVCDVMIDLEPA